MTTIARRIIPAVVLAAVAVSSALFTVSLTSASALSTSAAEQPPPANNCRAPAPAVGTNDISHTSDDSTNVTIPIHVTVRGGRLELAATHLSLELTRVDARHYTASLDNLRFMDTRGTYTGWDLTASNAAVTVDGRAASASVRVAPDDVTVVNGIAGGIENPGTQDATAGTIVLAHASTGCGAGIYAVSGTVDVELGADAYGTVNLHLDLGLS